MPVFEGSALQQASGAPTTSSIAASHIADSLVRDTCTHLRDSKKQDRQKKRQNIPEDIFELGRSIGVNDLCWMRAPKCPENFAHLCVVHQFGQGEDNYWISLLKFPVIVWPRCSIRLHVANTFDPRRKLAPMPAYSLRH